MKFISYYFLIFLVICFPSKVVTQWQLFVKASETLNPTEQNKHVDIAHFVKKYFEKNYIGREKNGQWDEARFPIQLWNVHDATLKGKQSLSLSLSLLEFDV